MITLSNRSRANAITIQLPAECGTVAHEHRSIELNPETGETGIRILTRNLLDSVHVHPGETSRQLPDFVAELREVKAHGRDLIVNKIPEMTPATVAPKKTSEAK